MSITRDTPKRPNGFAVIDGNYVSARWPGDAHRFSRALADLLRIEAQVPPSVGLDWKPWRSPSM
jgi:hypothetical protein